MANIAVARIKREFKEVIKSEEVFIFLNFTYKFYPVFSNSLFKILEIASNAQYL